MSPPATYLRKRRAAVKYLETDTDSDSSESQSTSLRRSSRVKPKSDWPPTSDEETRVEFQRAAPAGPSLPTRSTRGIGYLNDTHRSSYNERASTSTSEPVRACSPPSMKSRKSLPRKRTIGPTPSRQDGLSFKRRKVTGTGDSGIKSQERPPVALSTVRYPPWQTLPYHVLLRIMQYAISSSNGFRSPSTNPAAAKWLLRTAKLCRSFHEPCISTLLYDPPMHPLKRAQAVLNTLEASKQATLEAQGAHGADTANLGYSFDYCPKVKSLRIEVTSILAKKQGIHVEQLLASTPMLKQLILLHRKDDNGASFLYNLPRYIRDNKWSYQGLWDTLDRHSIMLSSFEFNDRFLKLDPSYNSLVSSTLLGCLRRLKSLVLRNLNIHEAKSLKRLEPAEFDVAISDAKDTDLSKVPNTLLDCQQNVAAALSNLTELQELTFHGCNILNGSLVSSLPSRLNRLEINSCPHIYHCHFNTYMHACGSALHELTLINNQALSLGFLSDLQTTAPHLEHLEVDMSFKDVETPDFPQLLPSGTPSWPRNLQSLSVGPLRNLTAAEAEAFFQSLVDAAPEMKYLRHLELKTILDDVDWRGRAKLRSKWHTTFSEVFQEDDSEYSTSSSKRSRSAPKRGQQQREGRQGRCRTVVFELSDQRPTAVQLKEDDFLDDPSGNEDGDWNAENDSIGPPRYSAREYAW